jgi:hypothetical protein
MGRVSKDRDPGWQDLICWVSTYQAPHMKEPRRGERFSATLKNLETF